MATATYFVDAGLRPRRLCVKRHKPGGKPCEKPHAVPADALWSGDVNLDLRGDFVIEVRQERNEWRKALRRWERKLLRLRRQFESAAPAFRTYAASLLVRHEAALPAASFRQGVTHE